MELSVLCEENMEEVHVRKRGKNVVSWKRSVGRRVSEFLLRHLRWGVEGILAIPFMHFLLNSEHLERKEGCCVREWPRLP